MKANQLTPSVCSCKPKIRLVAVGHLSVLLVACSLEMLTEKKRNKKNWKQHTNSAQCTLRQTAQFKCCLKKSQHSKKKKKKCRAVLFLAQRLISPQDLHLPHLLPALSPFCPPAIRSNGPFCTSATHCSLHVRRN